MSLSDGSSWPLPDRNDDGDLCWRLTYGRATRGDVLAAVAIISAYDHLVTGTTRDRRDLVCREIRAALEVDPRPAQEPNIGDTCCGKCPADTCYVDQVTGA